MMRFYSRNPKSLILVGIVSTVYGLYLIKKGWDGDTLIPGTNFTYLPKWLFYTVGAILQFPLPLSVMFLKSQGHL